MERIDEEKRFKNFNDTYRYCSFALAISLFYPNKNNIKTRLGIMVVLIIVHSAMLFWFSYYTITCLIAMDLFNTARNITLGVLISMFFVKFFYSLYKTETYTRLLKKISHDLLMANGMNECCQKIYIDHIKKGKFGELTWIYLPILLTAQFPIYAAVRNAYYTIVSDELQRVMVHETDLLGLEDRQYDTPYFEIIFAYNSSQAITVASCFVGFDASFCIATTHLRLKLKLLTHKIHSTFNKAAHKNEIKSKLKEIVRDHQAVIAFFDDLQDMYGGWLFLVFAITSITISLNVYLIYVLQRMDPKYVTFTISCIIHMLTPCYYSSQIIQASEESAVDFYLVNWEKWADPAITKTVMFMIARAQQPMLLTGMGIVQFNMQLFISVMQFAYSFFTLITS